MNIRKAGAWLWVAGLLSFVPQIIAASRWPEPYSYLHNLISDLGVTSCGVFDEGTRVERYICSPWFGLANAGTIVSGILITVGAILLWNLWPRKRSGRLAMALMALGGLLVVAVGLFPWDTHPVEHDATALLQAFFQWAAMICLLVALRGFAHWRSISRLTALFLVISVVGFVMFINALSGGTAFGLGVGALERIAFDSLVVWTAVVGLVLLRSQPMMQPSQQAQIQRSTAPQPQ